jgi:hypothetical protein
VNSLKNPVHRKGAKDAKTFLVCRSDFSREWRIGHEIHPAITNAARVIGILADSFEKPAH